MRLYALIFAGIVALMALAYPIYLWSEAAFWAYVGGNAVLWGGLAILAASICWLGGEA